MFDSKKKEMLENLKNDKEYIDELKILNELLKYDKCVVPSKEFNIRKRHKRLEFLAYMYGYNLSVKSLKEDYIFMITKREEYTPTSYIYSNIIEKLECIYLSRKEKINYEKTIANNIFNGILDSENGVFIPKNSELYELLNLNIICYLEEYLDYREMKLITYKTSDGIYFNSKFKEYILGIKL